MTGLIRVNGKPDDWAAPVSVRSDHVTVMAESSEGSSWWAWWKVLLIGSAILAVPTAVAPAMAISDPLYLCGSIWLTSVLCWAVWRMPRVERLPWLLLAVVALMWLTGDALVRVQQAAGGTSDSPGISDLIWLLSYPVEIMAVNALNARRRGFMRGTRKSGTRPIPPSPNRCEAPADAGT